MVIMKPKYWVYGISLAIVLIILGILLLHIPIRIIGANTIWAAYAPDGIHFTEREPIFALFGLTSGIKLKDKTLAFYGVDFAMINGIADEKTGYRIYETNLLISKDGRDFERKRLRVSNLDRNINSKGNAVIVELPAGGYRIYAGDYLHRDTVSFYSENGYDLAYEGPVQGIPDWIVDPTAFYEKNSGRYYIYVRSGKEGYLAVFESGDGRNFTRSFEIPSPFNIKFAIVDDGDRYRVYGRPFYGSYMNRQCTDENPCPDLRYPVLAFSEDGLNWTKGEQIAGPWSGSDVLVGSSFAIKEEEGYRVY